MFFKKVIAFFVTRIFQERYYAKPWMHDLRRELEGPYSTNSSLDLEPGHPRSRRRVDNSRIENPRFWS